MRTRIPQNPGGGSRYYIISHPHTRSLTLPPFLLLSSSSSSSSSSTSSLRGNRESPRAISCNLALSQVRYDLFVDALLSRLSLSVPSVSIRL
ncbi:hypothetical protein L484_011472 [Morus notabilis]|uniref:Uncharacterized protein n=1 Tax=Morus notabilis TaxID=981085 RepID=W9RG90_9ROSA|nr:hypothetical protein L484_011472 [Morus notabilis]